MRNPLGYFAATGACAAATGYGIAQILQIAGLVPTPLDRWLIFAPSLALAPLFLIAVAASAADAPLEARALRYAALGFAIAYAVMVSGVYILQLGVVLPGETRGDASVLAGLACCDAGRPLTAIDLLGYGYMSLATLLLGVSYRTTQLRWALVINGLLAPIIVLQLAWPSLIFWASPWLLSFPLAMAVLAREFAQGRSDTLEVPEP